MFSLEKGNASFEERPSPGFKQEPSLDVIEVSDMVKTYKNSDGENEPRFHPPIR